MLTGFDRDHLSVGDAFLEQITGFDRLHDTPSVPRGLLWSVKSVVERGVAVGILLVLSPFLVLIALAIVVESGRPILFLQPRFGLGGVPFLALKFRSMYTEACDVTGAGQTGDIDPRITRVGYVLRKTSLDELPQLWNVVIGQMALVGPRAHPCGMQVQGVLCEAAMPQYHTRHVVLPGITGWAQVNGSRGAVKTPDMLQRRVALDLHYIQNWSPWLDLWILWRTIWVVLSRRQAK